MTGFLPPMQGGPGNTDQGSQIILRHGEPVRESVKFPNRHASPNPSNDSRRPRIEDRSITDHKLTMTELVTKAVNEQFFRMTVFHVKIIYSPPAHIQAFYLNFKGSALAKASNTP